MIVCGVAGEKQLPATGIYQEASRTTVLPSFSLQTGISKSGVKILILPDTHSNANVLAAANKCKSRILLCYGKEQVQCRVA
jgi:hypothetical protein